jgi:D-alanyl-D-alanine carboxypeptidase/D-alanyl-D-alanine-endopeptidase (penicillin-binding protein 4)
VAVTGSQPAMPYLTFKSELLTGAAGTGDQAYAYLPMAGSNIMYVRGTYATDQTKKAIGTAIPDPPFDLAWHLTDTLKLLGITVTEKPESGPTLVAKGCHTNGCHSPAYADIAGYEQYIVLAKPYQH